MIIDKETRLKFYKNLTLNELVQIIEDIYNKESDHNNNIDIITGLEVFLEENNLVVCHKEETK